MQHQRAALAIATATVVGAALFGIVAWRAATATSSADDTAARHEARALEAVLAGEARSLASAARALLNTPEVVAYALGGPPAALLDAGATVRGGADYLLLIGPGRKRVTERGRPATLVPTGNLVNPAENVILTGAPNGAIVANENLPVLVAGASTGGGVDDAAAVLGRILDADAVASLADALGRDLALRWDFSGTTPVGVRWTRDRGLLTVEMPVGLAVGDTPLVATIEGPAPATSPAAGATPWIGLVMLSALVGTVSLAMVTGRMSADVSALGRALRLNDEGEPDIASLDRMRGGETGEAARTAVGTLLRLQQDRVRAVEDARVATARQLLGEHVIRSMHEGVLVERPDTTCIVCNPAAVGLLGIGLRDVLGSRDSIRRVLGEALFADLKERAEGKSGGPVLITRSGNDLAIDAYRVPEPGGDRFYFLVIVRDVSAVLETERLKRDVVSVVSHELRTPLTVLNVVTGMLREVEESERDRLLTRAEQNVQRMRELVDDMLDLARLESGQVELDRAPEDVAVIAAEVAQLLQPNAVSKQITLHLAANGETTLSCDRRQMTRAITNLVSNAVKFTPDGGDVRLETQRDGPVITVDVIDSGPGVPPEERDRIFSRFYRASNTRAVSGTGLGLTIVAQVAELHGGSVRLVPSERGAHFRLTLPA